VRRDNSVGAAWLARFLRGLPRRGRRAVPLHVSYQYTEGLFRVYVLPGFSSWECSFPLGGRRSRDRTIATEVVERLGNRHVWHSPERLRRVLGHCPAERLPSVLEMFEFIFSDFEPRPDIVADVREALAEHGFPRADQE
jgi:hypothetical protein